MSPNSDRFRERALAAERSASATADPELKRKFLDIARNWHALAVMEERGHVVLDSTEKPEGT